MIQSTQPLVSNPLQGIALKLGSVVVFITMASLIKAAEVPAGEAVFFRSFFALPVIVAWLALRGELRTGFYVANPWGHALRGIMGSTAMGMGFAGLLYLPLPDATALGYAAPLLTVVFAAAFLGEKVRLFRTSMVGLGLCGVLIVLWPNLHPNLGTGQSSALGAALVLGGAVFSALAQITIRRLVQTEKTAAIVFYFSLTSTTLGLATIPFGWVMPSPSQGAMLVGAGLLGGVGQILLTSSYRWADASLIAPFEYASILFALGIGYFVFAEVPTGAMLSGAALVVLAGVLIIWRERWLGIERARGKGAGTL
jgi:drug/metabolite transporter (DMT)-like permease